MAPKRVKSTEKKGAVTEQGRTGPLVSERRREHHLHKECGTLAEHIDTYTQRVEHFQGENEFLDKEAQQIRENSKAYLAYLAKRTLRCQDTIITLNDQNRSDLAQVRKQKEELTSQYTDKEKEVRCQLIEMETKYSLMNREVEELQPFKELQSEQLTRIRELEKELLALKIQHSEQMHTVKSRFLQQKSQYEMESQQKVQALAKKAEKEAVLSLIQHTRQIKAENWCLRKELLNLIQRAQGLRAFMRQLQEQEDQLLREHQYSRDLAQMRHWLKKQQQQQPPQGAMAGTAPCSLSAKHRLLSLQPPESPPSVQQEAESAPPARMPTASDGEPEVPASRESPEHATQMA
ncbi:coiled-coil domain-containing protein 166-like [Hemicordylus capensis]|uniref:coiled-coil domain-containing protein 166-like n=1 Tax=Hemicordylus capensis TaxID=884348 RepID=UPI002302EA5F|nr:coiled-coil domain-containing protein 166-like [Hemicordylus capensis]